VLMLVLVLVLVPLMLLLVWGRGQKCRTRPLSGVPPPDGSQTGSPAPTTWCL